MNILLLGEYSRLHNSLKEGLVSLGHNVILAAGKDRFKNFPNDICFEPKLTQIKVIYYIHKLLVKLRIINIQKLETALRFYFFIINEKKYDHIQFINSDFLKTYPFLSRYLYKIAFKKSDTRSLLVCGDETPIVKFQLKEKNFYSVHTPYLEDKKLKNIYSFSLKYQKKCYEKTFNMLLKHCQTLITSDLDYEIPMKKMGYSTNFIPNPINTDKITVGNPHCGDKTIIFLGVNKLNHIKKGIPFFLKALELIENKYYDKVEVIITENIPYTEYITLYNNAHILLDQVYSYDQGYNALEAMAKGKVVFTGAEEEWRDYYNIKENKVVINAKPNVENIYKNLEFLIKNPEKLTEIGNGARLFIEMHHNYIDIAQKYIDAWTQNTIEPKIF